jgi:predicted acyl esterase
VFRARFRESFEFPQPLTPGQPTKLKFELLDVLHNFKAGHRLMIHVQSTWFPLVDRNPQVYVPNIFLAKPEDFRKATQRIWRTKEHPSNITARVLTR